MSTTQYTIRGVAPRLGAQLRAVARETGRSVNQVILDALTKVYGQTEPGNRDLDGYCGTWVEDPEFDRAVGSFREIDPQFWK